MKSLTTLLILWSVCLSYAQEQRVDTLAVDTLSIDTVAQRQIQINSLMSEFTAEDSLAIFDLIDSLLTADPTLLDSAVLDKSQLAVRLGYNSNITSDSRTFNLSQYGIAPGVSYYHKSGVYADLTTYWSNEYYPSFYLTIPSVGYMHTFSKHYSLLAEYSHFFYNQAASDSIAIPYTNSIGVGNYFEFKPFVLRLDYYLYFGERTNHRVMPSIGLNVVKSNWLGFDRIAFFPAFVVMFGSEQVYTYGVYDNLLLRILWNRTHVRQVPLYYENTSTEFGVMNYGFSFPISFTKKDWSFLISYAYNMPRALPGETLYLESSGYLSFSITKYFLF